MGMVFGRIDTETAPFELLPSPSAEYELRQYPPSLIAETDSEQGPKGDNVAFRRLANYIGVFKEPHNTAKAPIAMTAPVMSAGGKGGGGSGGSGGGEAIAMTAPVMRSEGSEEGGSGGVLAFIMPAQYTLETLPTPTSPDVRIKQVPGCTVAALTFSGTATDEDAAAKTAALRAMLQRDGLQEDKTGAPTLARFNPPFTLSFLKTNEVHVPIVVVEQACSDEQ
jgi:hypothetical protein